MAVRLRRKYHPREPETHLNITAMVDMFTLILVFLLKSFSTSVVQVAPVDDLRLPQSVIYTEPAEALRLIVTRSGIYVEEQKIVIFENRTIASKDRESTDPNFIRPLYDELEKYTKKAEEIKSKNSNFKFTGAYILQADENLDYATLKSVIYTAMLAGYADMKLGAMGE